MDGMREKNILKKTVLQGLLPYILFILVSVMLINVEMVYTISVVTEEERKQGTDGLEEYIGSRDSLQNRDEDSGEENDLQAFLDLQQQYFESSLYRLFLLTNVVVLLSGGALIAWKFFRYLLPVKEVIRRVNGTKDIRYGNLVDELTMSLEDYKVCKARLGQIESIMETDFIEKVLNAEFKSEGSLRAEAENAGIDLYGYRYQVLVAGIYNNVADEDVDAATIYESTKVLDHLKLELEREVNLPGIWAKKLSYRRLAIVLQLQDSFPLERLYGLGEEFRQKYGVNIYWGISRSRQDPLYLWKCKEEAYIAVSCCDAEHVCIEYSPELDAGINCYFPLVARSNLLAYIRSGNEEETGKIIALLKEENCGRRALSHNQFITLNGRVIRMLEKFQEQDGYNTEAMIDSLNGLIIGDDGSHEEYFDCLNTCCMELCRKCGEEKKDKKNRLAEQIKEFVDNNFQDSSLSLTKLGVAFNISDSYVSLIFKECYGINFSAYVEEIRIRRAGRLLEDTALTVREIAQQTGYTSEQSFRRAFKKVRGISPKDARGVNAVRESG